MRAAQLSNGDRLVLLGDYIDRGPDSMGVIDWVLDTRKTTEIVALRGNHEEMMLQSRLDASVASSWSGFGGFEALDSYGTTFLDDWVSAVPRSHWEFLENLPAYFETNTHIFVHGSVDGRRPREAQNEYEMVWGRKFGISRHVSGRRVVCGHTPEEDGEIGVYSWGYCLDTGCCRGDWLSCLDVDSLEFWQANEQGETRRGRVADVE
jgi:serine/threonine protein phosphatase 1